MENYLSGGIRQGDAISPYIFVLCMERLAHIIQSAIVEGKWKTIQLSRNGPKLSHLLFADDLILFVEASMEQINIVKDCLDKFSVISCQKVNFQKSSNYFSNGVPSKEAKEIARIVGIPLIENLGRDLGTPSIHGRVSSSLYQEILNRMTSKLESWKAKYLTMAGRITLAQSVLIAIYHMQTTLLPRGLCSSMDVLIRKFIWRGAQGRQKVHLIN